jgi:rubrerythrin
MYELRQQPELLCSVCGSPRNDEEQRSNAITIEIFGANWLGMIREGRCPLCLGDATYRPRAVRERWYKYLAENGRLAVLNEVRDLLRGMESAEREHPYSARVTGAQALKDAAEEIERRIKAANG